MRLACMLLRTPFSCKTASISPLVHSASLPNRQSVLSYRRIAVAVQAADSAAAPAIQRSGAASSSAEAPTRARQRGEEEVNIHFKTDGVFTTAKPGENLWANQRITERVITQVASKCGISIPISCGTGSCGTCEMEVRKWDAAGNEGGTATARTCIAAVPPGYARLEIDPLDDGIWGADGFDM